MTDRRNSELEGNWEQVRGRLREAWGALTDDDVERSKGNWEQTVGAIRERTGEATETIETKLNEIIDKVKSSRSS